MLKNFWTLITTNKAVIFVVFIASIVIGFYFSNFHYGLSDDNGKWGTFGDYIGGILNPIIAGFAFYFVAKTYQLQKTETKRQIEIAALSALINAKLMLLDRNANEKKESKTEKGNADPASSKFQQHTDTYEMPYDTFMTKIEKTIKRLEKDGETLTTDIDSLQKKLSEYLTH